MSLWDEAGELEKIANQINCLSNVLELVAERLQNNLESGTLWLCKDVCDDIDRKLNERIVSLLEMFTKKNEQ